MDNRLLIPFSVWHHEILSNIICGCISSYIRFASETLAHMVHNLGTQLKLLFFSSEFFCVFVSGPHISKPFSFFSIQMLGNFLSIMKLTNLQQKNPNYDIIQKPSLYKNSILVKS